MHNENADQISELERPEMMDQPMSAREAAAALGISERDIRRAISSGRLAAIKQAGVYRIQRSDLHKQSTDLLTHRTLPNRRFAQIPASETPHQGAVPRRPRPLTTLIGREREAAAVVTLLTEERLRLLTLTGPGGIGKTRLALQVADTVEPSFRDGVAYVTLASIVDPHLVLPTITRVFDVREGSDQSPLERLIATLSARELLLVVDNFEHVLVASPLIAEILATCPKVSVLATSRARLNLGGEHIFAVPPLSLPNETETVGTDVIAEAEAVRLFMTRGRAVFPNFDLTPDNAQEIAAICRRLDGLPLAIELAATRVRVLPPSALLQRLDRQLSLLTDGPQDAPVRLRTMRNAIDWSYDLLTPDEQTLFRRLAVFAGGFSLEAAEAVGGMGEENRWRGEQGIGDRTIISLPPRRLAALPPLPVPPSILDGITSLVAKSLLTSGTGLDQQARFGMLETVREFALEQLTASGETTAINDAHAAWYLALAEQAKPALIGPDQGDWTARLESEIANLRAALRWLREQGRVADAMRLADGTGWFWQSPGHFQEGSELFESLIAMPGAAETGPLLAIVMGTAAGLAHWLGDLSRAQSLQERTRNLHASLGDDRGVGISLRGMGSVAIDQDEPAHAAELLKQALPILQQSGTDWDVAHTKHLLGMATFSLGDEQTAITYHEEALIAWRAMGDVGYTAGALTQLGLVALSTGQYERAHSYYAEALQIGHDAGDILNIVRPVDGLGNLAATVGDRDRGVHLLGWAEQQHERFGMVRRLADQGMFERIVRELRQHLGKTIFDAQWQAGKALSLDQVIREAASLPQPSDRSSSNLSPRQMAVLRLLAEGWGDAEIAEELFISRKTVSNHVAAIMEKFEVPNRTAAATLAVRLGLV